VPHWRLFVRAARAFYACRKGVLCVPQSVLCVPHWHFMDAHRTSTFRHCEQSEAIQPPRLRRTMANGPKATALF
jgi:hypothetical protein